MAGSPFDDIGRQAAAPAPASGIADAWRGFLAEPSNRAALLQFGVSMLGNRNIGESIGDAAQASTANQAFQQEQTSAAEETAMKRQKLALDERQVGLEARRTASDELRARKAMEPSTEGAFTQKDATKAWLDFVQSDRDSAVLNTRSPTPIADLRQQFNEMLSGAQAPATAPAAPATASPPAPAAGGTVTRMQNGKPVTYQQLPDGRWQVVKVG